MANKYYAWTEIRLGSEPTIASGTVVTPKQLGNDWDALLDAGSIRTQVYPKMPATWLGSVRSFRQEQIRALREGLDARTLLDIEDDDEGDDYLSLLASVEEGASE